MKTTIRKWLYFLRNDLWRVNLHALSGSKHFGLKALRIMALTVRGYHEDHCELRASALTFYSLISIVPIFALLFGIAKGFGFENILKDKIISEVPSGNEVIIQAIDISHNYLEAAKGGVVAGVGVLVLLWSVLKTLSGIELSFNDIWAIKKPRSLARKFSDYLAVLVIGSILLVLSSSLTLFVSARIAALSGDVLKVSYVAYLCGNWIRPDTFSSLSLKILPYLFIWLMFSFLYIFIPNTKVRVSAGLIAGIIAGTAYQLLQVFFIYCQVLVSKYNAIYGSFAALPLFLIWLQLSWLIMFLGAEVSFACQNSELYEFEPDIKKISHAHKTLIALKIVHLLVKNFCHVVPAWTAAQIASHLEAPLRLVREILYELTETGLVTEVSLVGDNTAYQPGQDVDGLTINYVLDALEKRGASSVPVAGSKELDQLSGSLKIFRENLQQSPANIKLKDL